MTEALVPRGAPAEVASSATIHLPALIVDAGPAAGERFLEFFAAQIANDRTRVAYARAAGQFLSWCDARGLTLRGLTPIHVAAYIRTHPGAAPTVKQHLAAIRVLCDWLVVSQVLPTNPAAAVRGPKHVVTKGSTPVLTAAETRTLFAEIDTGTVVGLRDRALIGVMVYSFARVSAVVGMRCQDYFPQGKRWWLRLQEKGGKRHDVSAHHVAEAYLDAYLEAGALDAPTAPLFQSVDRARQLTGRPLTRGDVLAMIKRRAAAADSRRRRAVTRSGRPASPRICRTAGPSSTRSRLPRMPRRRPRSSTTGRPTPSRSMRSNASSFDRREPPPSRRGTLLATPALGCQRTSRRREAVESRRLMQSLQRERGLSTRPKSA